jgi:hypothetical protein
MTKFTIFYLILGVGSIGTYGYATNTGWALNKQETRFVPKDTMRKPGGYRSFHYWHVGYGGYRGGK